LTYAQMHVGYRQKIASFSDGKFIQIYEVKEGNVESGFGY